MADYLLMAFLLFGFGCILLACEYFLPTGGLLLVVGVILCVVGVAVVARYGTVNETVAAMLVLGLGVPIATITAFSWWGRSAAARFGVPEDSGQTAAEIVTPVEDLKGRVGRTITPMRPSGAVEFEDRRYDALAEGPMLEANTWVQCVGVRAGRIIVRQVATPDEIRNLTLNDLT
ncbi:MAG: NfeD family protein [Gemmataceae bacterium]